MTKNSSNNKTEIMQCHATIRVLCNAISRELNGSQAHWQFISLAHKLYTPGPELQQAGK